MTCERNTAGGYDLHTSGVLRRLHEFAHWTARESSAEARVIPLFVLYQGAPADDGWSLAIPRLDAPPPSQRALAGLKAAVAAGEGTTPIVFIAELFPTLSPALRAAGFVISLQTPLMLCSPAMLQPPPLIPGLTVSVVTGESPIAEVQVALDVNEQGFDPSYSGHASIDAAEQFRQSLTAARAFIGRLDGNPVAGGMYQAPHAGITRLDGIATLEHYRRRGIGASLSATITGAAFSAGGELAFLSAANETAERLYTRIGYRRAGTIVTWVEERHRRPEDGDGGHGSIP